MQARQFLYFETAQPTTLLPTSEFQIHNQTVLWYQHARMERQALPLGANLNGLIYDIWHGFHPDTLAALCGCVLGGRPVVLLGPPLAQLNLFNDPMYKRMSSWPVLCPLHTHYLRQIQHSLTILVQQGELRLQTLPSTARLVPKLQSVFQGLAKKSATPSTPAILLTQEQTSAIHTIMQGLNTPSPQLWSILAQRGFGKTTLLQHLVAALEISDSQANQTQLEIYWISPTADLHNHIHLSIEALEHQLKTLDSQFMLSQQPKLLILDECAKINGPVLARIILQLLALANSSPPQKIDIILASSIDGYEGSGQALVQLAKQLDCQQLPLSKPLRWAEHDPLDQWIKHTLLSETPAQKEFTPITSIKSQVRLSAADARVSSFNPREINTQATWMALMRAAHYRTRPSDLRLMLDVPGQYCRTIQAANGTLLAGLWLSLEGPIPQALQLDIKAGKRRLKGHLAPQYVAKHQDPEAMNQPWLRIVRIAVLPELQKKGLGACLIKACQREYGLYNLAVSFRENTNLAIFWRKLKFEQITSSFWIFRKTNER